MENKLDAKINVSLLKENIDAIGVFNKECRFYVTPSGLSCSVVDNANVSMINVEIPDNWFEEYTSLDSSFCINVKEFSQMLSAFPKDEIIRIVVKDKFLLITGENCLCSITLLGDNEVRASITKPTELFLATIEITGKELSSIIKIVKKVSDKICLRILEDGNFVMDSVKETNCIRYKPTVEITNSSKSRVKSIYAIKYLEKISNVIKTNNNIALHLNNDYPIMITAGNVTFWCAPRVESD